MKNKQAFTLIELLVVVLIIGILAAVALPQYQKAVERAKASEALVVFKSVLHAADAYYLANGTWPTNFEELAIDIPWTGNEAGWSYSLDTKSNGEWSLQIYNYADIDMHDLNLTRLKGKYKGAYFFYHWETTLGTKFQATCSENNSDEKLITFSGNTGDYCGKVLHARLEGTKYLLEF